MWCNVVFVVNVKKRGGCVNVTIVLLGLGMCVMKNVIGGMSMLPY